MGESSPTRFQSMKTSLLPLAILALAPTTFGQSATYDLDIITSSSNFTFGGDTNLGPIVGTPNHFQMDGIQSVVLSPASGPFTSGELVGGDLYTVPSTITAKIPNIFSWLPNLADIYIQDSHLSLSSAPFSINSSTGAYTALVTTTFLSGTVVVIPLVGNTITLDLGTLPPGPPTTSTGTFTVAGGNVIGDSPVDFDVDFSDPASGMWANVWMDGDIVGSAPVSSGGAQLSVSNFTHGQHAAFNFTGGTPNTSTFMAYSLAGPGSTNVGQLGVTLGLASPVDSGIRVSTDGAGSISYSIRLPNGAQGIDVWLQGCQPGVVTNVLAETVQ